MIRGKKLVYGVGINDAAYVVTKYSTNEFGVEKQVWVCPFYKRWRSMLQRCYDPLTHIRHPTYIGCSVVEGWHTFSNFREWMQEQDWEGKDLDKDILGDGKLYSATTCCFVCPHLNKFLLERQACRGDYPIGVSYHKHTGKFQSNCRNPLIGAQEYLGLYTTPEDAHAAWKKRKHELACALADMQQDQRLSEVLRSLFAT